MPWHSTACQQRPGCHHLALQVKDPACLERAVRQIACAKREVNALANDVLGAVPAAQTDVDLGMGNDERSQGLHERPFNQRGGKGHPKRLAPWGAVGLETGKARRVQREHAFGGFKHRSPILCQ